MTRKDNKTEPEMTKWDEMKQQFSNFYKTGGRYDTGTASEISVVHNSGSNEEDVRCD